MKSKVPMDDYSVDVVRHLDELSTGASAAAYEKFVEELKGLGRLWYSPDWLLAAEPSFTRSGETPFFVMVRHGGEIIGVAPLLLHSLGAAPLHYRRLRFWGTGGRYLEYPTWKLLARSGDEGKVEDLVVRALEGTFSRHFDEISLARADPKDTFIERISAIFRVIQREDLGEQVHLFGNHRHIDDELPARYVTRFRKAEEKLRSSSDTFEMTTLSAVDERVIDEIRDLHIRRQHELIARGISRFSCFEDPIESKALLSMIEIAQQRGALRVYLQRVNGELTNFWICFASGGHAVAEIMASKKVPRHADATSCMTRYILKEEIEKHGTEWLDLGFGSNRQKTMFTNTTIPLQLIVLFNNRSLRSRLRYLALSGLRVTQRLLARGRAS